MRDRQRVALQAPAAVWPPDDSEESVVGTTLHQATIRHLCHGLNEIAGALAPPGKPWPWQALSQTAITGLQRPDGSAYTVLPAVFVYRQPIDEQRATLSLPDDGPPVLIVAVLSPTTSRNDLDLVAGKAFSYAQAGVGEYLVLDPAGEFVAEQGRAWRLDSSGYTPWLPDAAGRWPSAEIAATLAVEGLLVAVYSRDGRRQLREGEVARALAGKDAALARKDEQLAGKDAEIAALRRRLEELGRE